MLWREAAIRDAEQAIDWYVAQGASDARWHFESALDAMTKALESFPVIGREYTGYSEADAEIRILTLPGTPYVAIYSVTEGIVSILRILHFRRDIWNLV